MGKKLVLVRDYVAWNFNPTKSTHVKEKKNDDSIQEAGVISTGSYEV